jgi:hypothetical protein
MTEDEIKTSVKSKMVKAWFLNLLSSLIVVGVGFYYASAKGEVTEIKEGLKLKADKAYVDDKMVAHEAKEFEQLSHIEEILTLSTKNTEAIITLSTKNTEVIITKIDKRLERLEDRVNEK